MGSSIFGFMVPRLGKLFLRRCSCLCCKRLKPEQQMEAASFQMSTAPAINRQLRMPNVGNLQRGGRYNRDALPRSRLRYRSPRSAQRPEKKASDIKRKRKWRWVDKVEARTVEHGRQRWKVEEAELISFRLHCRPYRFHPPSTLSSCSFFTADQPSSFTPENHLLMLLCPNQHHRSLDFSSSPLVEIEEFANILNLAPLAHSTDFRVICEITYVFLVLGADSVIDFCRI